MTDDIDDLFDRDPVDDATDEESDDQPSDEAAPGEGDSGAEEASEAPATDQAEGPGDRDLDKTDAAEGSQGGSEDSSSASSSASGEEPAGSRGASDQDDSVPEERVPSPVTAPDADEVGHVLASEEIVVGRDEHHVNAFVTTARRSDVRVGDYVQVSYPDEGAEREELFAVVDRLRYEPYTELDDKSDTHNRISQHRQLDESEFVLVAELEPLSTLTADGDTLDRGVVNRVPKPNTTVRLARDEDVLRTGLNIPGDGIFCGYLSVGGDRMVINDRPFPYYLSNPTMDPETGEPGDGEPAVFRHMLVAGSTGKGKTHFTKNVLRQFVDGGRYSVEAHGSGDRLQQRLGTLIIDPENEYAEMGEDNPDLPGDVADRLRRQNVQVGGVDDCSVFVPNVNKVPNPSTGEATTFGVPFSLVKGRHELLLPRDPPDATRHALRQVLSAYFDAVEREDGPDGTYREFMDYLDANEEALQDRFTIAGASWNALNRIVDSRTFTDVFDQGATTLPELTDEMFREGRVSVVPTSHLRGAKERLVVLSLLSLVIENKIDDHNVDTAIKDTPLLVAVDEAHNYFSSPETTRERYIVHRAREAVKQGRKDKLGLALITQNPEDVDDEILKQINTNIFLGLRDEVVEKVPSVPSAFKRDIPKFGKGQAVVKAPDVEAVEVVGLRYCVTKHGN
jgi:DNA helicase HerA-like ATPase